MIRVVHLITELNVGGAEIMLQRLVSRMDRQRFSNTVVSMTSAGPIGALIRAEGTPVSDLGMPDGVPSPVGALRLWTLLRRERPHILQTWLYHADLLGLLVGRTAGVPTIVWNLRCSDLDLTRYSRTLRWVVKACGSLSALPEAIVANSEAGREHHARIGYRPRRWVLLPNGVDLETFRPNTSARQRLRAELGLSSKTPLIGLVARFDPMKDHRTFLEAAALLHRSRPDVHFMLAGLGLDSPNRRLADWLEELGIAPAVHLLGVRHDIHALMAGLDIATSSSAFGEGFPTAIAEAMACGVPCVVTNVGDSAVLVGDTGRVVPPRDPAALAAAWLDLLQSDSRRAACGLAARARAEGHFALDAVVRQYERLYEECFG